MRMTFQKPQWDHTVTGRKGRTSGKVAGAPDQAQSWRSPSSAGKRTSEARKAIVGPSGAGAGSGNPRVPRVPARRRR